MNFYRNNKSSLPILILVMIAFCSVSSIAQHRGDNLSFQGLSFKDNVDVKASAMGGAVTAIAGNLSSLFYNPAGLAKIDKIQISVSANQYNRHWRENQNYYANRNFTSLPFYLEGLYVPKIENNGKYDGDLYKDTLGFLISAPKLGYNEYDEEVAQWKNDKNEFGLKNISVAIPFSLGNRKFVAAASYYKTQINDFDRNDTYLSPMITSYDYETGFKRIVNGVDTLNLKWSRFLRSRYGNMNNIVAGISNEIFENVMIGVGMKIQSGESDDYMSIKRAGDFHLIDAQKFKFYFVDYIKEVSGTSKFNSTSFNIGAMVSINRIKMGLKVDLPYTLTREWNYVTTEKGIQNTSVTQSLKDEVKMPATYNFGISFQPVDSFTMAFAFESNPYTKAEFNFGAADSTFRKWSDQNILSFGMEYKMFSFLSIMAGYRSVPEVFIPDGAAIKDRGPISNSYNIGLSVNTFLGCFDIAYEYRSMKYYDSYYSNANYVFERTTNILIGYTYSL